MLTLDAGPTLNWTWDGDEPDHWTVQESDDGVSGWFDRNDVPGGTHTDTGDPTGEFYRVVGRDAFNVDVTDPSNVVESP